jgi:protein OS-9
MVIQTPRLCNDVAFLPPQKDQPNAITCSPILREDEIEDYERDLEEVKEAERETAMWKAEADAMGGDEGFQPSLLPVGDIFVGEHRLVPEGVKIEKSVIVGGGRETYIDTVASSDGKVAGKEELEKLGLADTKAIEKLRKELEKIAQGQNWKLDVIDTPHGREYRGVIGDDDAEQDESAAGAKGEREGGGKESGGKESGKGSGGKESGSKKAEGSKGGKGSTEGLSQDGHESKKGKGEKETEIRKGKAVKPGKGDGRDAEKGESGQEEKEGKQQQQQGSEEEYYKEEL